ncbi:MAG: hypothetical protein EPN99_00990 [Frankiales bacterium]|nr:MAG: hypothetical protein EPN99_00990 [Frankiales bacterium]
MSRLPYVLSALALAGLVGCSSSDVPDESAFAEGTCRTAAADVRAVGQSLPELGDGGAVDGDVRAGLREAHDRLRALADGAEPALQPVLAELNEKIGIVRIRADGNTYEPRLGELLAASYERVLEACTTR